MLSWVGLAAAGILNGSFAVPMKTAKHWSVEHIWAVFSLLAMTVLPWLAVWTAIPEWRSLLDGLPTAGLVRLLALGFIWGVASLLYGLAVDALGVALGISIQLGLSIVAGAILPRLWLAAAPAQSPGVFYAGVALMVAGVVVCARAGQNGKGCSPRGDRSRFRRGLVIAVLGGLGAPLLNIGIQYGTDGPAARRRHEQHLRAVGCLGVISVRRHSDPERLLLFPCVRARCLERLLQYTGGEPSGCGSA